MDEVSETVSETLARILDRTGNYRILRRVPRPIPSTMTDAERVTAGLAIGIILDTETTGLGVEDEIIEIGMIRFAFDPIALTIAHVVEESGSCPTPRPPGFSTTRQSNSDRAARRTPDT